MSGTTNTDIEIGTGLEICSSCKSDSWKSAKMVVMEGTTFTDGTISGDITELGKLTSLRAFLLSDRWFSWEHQLDAEVNFTTRTGLVEAVKKFMVSQAEKVQMPPVPVRPKEPIKIGFMSRITPVMPTPPSTPPIPVPPKAIPWYSHYGSSMLSLLLSSAAIVVISLFTGFSYGAVLGVAIFIFGIPINLIRSFSGDKRVSKKYEEKVSLYAETVMNHGSSLKQYEKDLQKYKLDCKKAAEQKAEEARKMAQYNNELSKYEIELAKHEARKIDIMKYRELLWERARICMRCGSAYLGNC